MTDHFDNQLFDAFDDFAAAERSTATQAPGAAAVRRTVAVQRRNRSIMLGLLAAVVVAIPVAAYAANPRGNNSPPLPGASATISDSPSATGSPAQSPSGSPSATATDPVPGMYLYRVDRADGTITNDVLHRAPGGDWQKIATVKAPTVQSPYGPPPMTMAPDRQHIAWLDNGTLKVSAVDGSHVKTLASNVSPGTCPMPSWTSDSRHLLFFEAVNQGRTLQSIAVDGTGRRTLGSTAAGIGCDFGSVDGRTAYAVTYEAKHKLVVFDGGAAPTNVTATWPSGREPSDVIAAEVGSTRLLVATVSQADGCGCSPPQQYAIVDTATGQVTSLDNRNDKAGSAPISGMFTADGRVVLIADRNKGSGPPVDAFLTVFSSAGGVLGSVPLPDMEIGHLVGFDN